MISFNLFQLYSYNDNLYLHIIEVDSYILKWMKFGAEGIETELFKTSLKLELRSKRISSRVSRVLAAGFIFLYSYHNISYSVNQLEPGKFICSRFYHDFHAHLGCNVRSECVGGEDETSTCPYFHSRCPPESLYVNVSFMQFQKQRKTK